MTNEDHTDLVLRLACRAIRKIDRDGGRGITNVSCDELEALALTVVEQARMISHMTASKGETS